MSWGRRGRSDDYWGYSSSGPIKVQGGIKAKSQRGKFGESWWAGRWIAALERLVDSGRLSRGRSYARNGQVVKLDVSANGVAALVQGSMPKPYKVTMTFTPLDDATWTKVIDAMAEQAIYAAKLLSGEMPETIEEVFTAAGASLFPDKAGQLQTNCSCPDYANPCKHVAAAHYLLGERFDTDPFLIFELRGRSQAQVAEALRARRAAATGEAEAAPPAATEADIAPPIDDSPANYWGLPDDLAAKLGHFDFNPPTMDAVVIKRLGAPPFWRESTPFETLMERDYRAISAAARKLALGDPKPPAETNDVGATHPLKAQP